MRNKLKSTIPSINLGSGNGLCSFIMCTGEYIHLYCRSVMFVGREFLVVLLWFYCVCREQALNCVVGREFLVVLL